MKNQVYLYLQKNKMFNAQNAIHVKDIAEQLNISKREVRRQKQNANDNKFYLNRIVSTQKGYYLTKSLDDVKTLVYRDIKKAIYLLKRAKSLNNQINKEGQVTFDFDNMLERLINYGKE